MVNKRDETAEYLKQFQQQKDRYQKDLKDWTPEEFQEHKKTLEQYYGRSIRTDNLLGRFDDPKYDYYWHTVDKQNPQLLEKRMAMGYAIVQDEQGIKLGLKRSKDASKLGSVVTMPVGDSKEAVLLRIPKELKHINDEIKRRRNEENSKLDHSGEKLDISKKEFGDTVEVHTKSKLFVPKV